MGGKPEDDNRQSTMFNCVQSAVNLSSAEQLIEELVEQAERLEGGGAKEGGSGAIEGSENGEAGMAQFLLRQTVEALHLSSVACLLFKYLFTLLRICWGL